MSEPARRMRTPITTQQRTYAFYIESPRLQNSPILAIPPIVDRLGLQPCVLLCCLISESMSCPTGCQVPAPWSLFN